MTMGTVESSESRRILVFCQDVPPSWSSPTSGGGVRCWSLAGGLEARGHSVFVSVPRTAVADALGAPREARELAHTPGELMAVVREVDPDVVLTVQWPLAWYLEELHVPLVIDLYGSMLLENLFFPTVHWESFVARKVRSLYLGDFFLCASHRQLAYFLPWLLQAGVELAAAPVRIAPLSLPPVRNFRRPCPDGEPHFIAAGILWPWQNPGPPLMALLRVLDEIGEGKLTIVGGPHPQWKRGIFPGVKPEWPKDVLNHPRVDQRPPLRWDELNELMATAHIGVDLSLPNWERILSVPTRIYHYLWNGLPVLVSSYLELASVITAKGVGWAADPTSDESVRQTVLAAVASLESWQQMSQKAPALVSSWEAEPQALYDFCSDPTSRRKTPDLEQKLVAELAKVYKGLGNAEGEIERLRVELEKTARLSAELAGARDHLDRIRNSFPYRIYLRLRRVWGLD
jgi:hypothetical protein